MIKKIKRVISFAFALLLASGTLTSCFAGIGDGAIFNDVSTNAKTEAADITLQPEDVAVAKLVAYNSDRSVMGKLSLTDADAEELYEYLTDSSNYTNDTETDMMSKASIQIDFEGINGKINLDSQNAVVVFEVFYIDSDDIVSMQSLELDMGRTGRFDGVYETLLLKILDSVTEEEKAAGVKLNCLRVKMIPGISRTFFLSEFESIGAFYMEESVDLTGHYAIVYFASCTPEELEDKRAEVKKNSVVDTVQPVFVIESGVPSVNY